MARRFRFNLRTAFCFALQIKSNSKETFCFLFVTKPLVKRNYWLNETASNENTV
jgi:hypothetical protein